MTDWKGQQSWAAAARGAAPPEDAPDAGFGVPAPDSGLDPWADLREALAAEMPGGSPEADEPAAFAAAPPAPSPEPEVAPPGAAAIDAPQPPPPAPHQSAPDDRASTPEPKRRKTVVVAAILVGVVALLAGAAFVGWQAIDGSSQPATETFGVPPTPDREYPSDIPEPQVPEMAPPDGNCDPNSTKVDPDC